MISIISSTTVLFPPAFRHASATVLARVLYGQERCRRGSSLATAVSNPTASMSGATLLFPYIPIPRYSARTAISHRSYHCARMICGNPALEKHVRVRTKWERCSRLIYSQGNFILRICPTVMDIGDDVRVLHDRSRVNLEPINDLEPLLIPRIPQCLLDQTLEFGSTGKFPKELSVREY